MEVIKIKKPSPAILRKLRKGENGTIQNGDDFEILVNPDMAKKIKKAHSKNKGIRVKLENDAISEMEGKGLFGSLKKGFSKVGKAVGKVADKVSTAVIGKSATKAIEKTGKIALGTAGKVAKTVGLATAKSLPQILKTAGTIGGASLGTALAVETGNPEFAVLGGYLGSQLGGVIGQDVGEEGKKLIVPIIRGKKKSTKKTDLPDRIPIPSKPKLPSPKDPKKPAVPKKPTDPYANRDVSGRLKTFRTTTGAMIDAVPVESQFLGSGKPKKPSKKGSQEMKDKMAKLRAMKGKGIIAEGSGEGLYKHKEEKFTTLPIKIKPIKGMGLSGEGIKSNEMKKAKNSLLNIEKIINSLKENKMEGKGLVAEGSGEGMYKHKDEKFTTLPIKIKPIRGEGLLGEDPKTYTPNFVIHRPDVQRNHNIKFRPNRYDNVSGSKLLGRMHQGHLSQPHRMNHMWKHTLGLPK